MASAKITITLTPEEYKILRNEIVLAKNEQAERSKPSVEGNPAERREAAKRTMQLEKLLKEI